MSGPCQTVSEMIAVEDEEDVEIVYTNLDRSHIYRNLMQRKISQEIELLRSISKQRVPDTFNQFKELAKTLDSQYGDDVILSAWQRIVNSLSKKLIGSPNNRASVCHVGPQQNPPQLLLPISSPILSVRAPSSLTLGSPAPIPVALLLNKNVSSRRKKCSTNVPKFIHTIELLDDDVIDQPPNESCDKPGEQVLESEDSHSNSVSPADNIVSQFDAKKNSKKRKMDSSILSPELDQNNLSSFVLEGLNKFETSFSNPTTTDFCDSVVSVQNQTSEKKCIKKSSQGRTSSSKQLSVNSPNAADPAIAKSHIGIKAKIVRTKQSSSTNSRRKLSATIREMSDEELKEFKAEQKRLKLQQKREFEIQQLQKVHDRLVDVLIPKYHNKTL